MSPERFLEQFGHLVDAPNGIVKLRELILQLAVRGKLVPQDPNDESASVLLEKIRAEKERLVAEGKLQKTKPLPAVEPHQTPSGWESARLGDVVSMEYGKGLPAKARNEEGKFPVYGSNGIVGNHDSYLIEKPSIIVGRKGSSGALNIADGECWPTDVTYYVLPPEGVDLRFCFLLLKSLNLEHLGKGIKPGLNRNEAYLLPVSLPPSAEQSRIVAKVDQLMALCDELEAKINANESASRQFAEALVAKLAA